MFLIPLEGSSNENFKIQIISPGKPKSGDVLLQKLPSARTGINFKNLLFDKTHTRNQISLNGSGVAAGDFDNDGLCDLYFCGLDTGNKLFKNLGNLKFKDVTEFAGVACHGRYSTGAAFIDINGDFYPELLVNSIGQGTLIFFNNHNGKFEDVTRGNGFNRNTAGMTIAASDINGDQYLDIYITNYRLNALMDNPGTRFSFDTNEVGKKFISHVNGRPIIGTPDENRYVINRQGSVTELGEVDAIYINDGGKSFNRIQFTEPIFRDSEGNPISNNFQDWGLSARFEDLNGDGRQDLYVCNDFETPDRIWIQKLNGEFHLLSDSSLNRMSFFSMGVDFSDYNRDGLKDILVIDMLPISPKDRHNILLPQNSVFDEEPFKGPPQYSWNTLLQNTSNETWFDVGASSGLAATGWSWSVVFNDVDLDGWEDVLITNGVERDGRDIDVSQKLASMRKSQKFSNEEMFDARSQFPTLDSPDLAFRNNGNGQFTRVPGWGFETKGVSHGMALADLDNDGDLDIIVNHQEQEASVFINTSLAPRVQVRLYQRPPNTRAIGGIVHFQNGSFNQIQEVVEGGRYLSDDQPVVTFPVPNPQVPIDIKVSWPDGSEDNVKNVPQNSIVNAFNLQEKTDPKHNSNEVVIHPNFESFVLRKSKKTDVGLTAKTEDFSEEFLRDPHWLYAFSKLGPRFQIDGASKEISYQWKGKNWTSSLSDPKSWEEEPAFKKYKLSPKQSGSLVSIQNVENHSLLLFGLNYLQGSMNSQIQIYNQKNELEYEFKFPQGIEVGSATIADLNRDSYDEIVIPVTWNYQDPAKSRGLYVFQMDDKNKWTHRDDWSETLNRAGPTMEIASADIDGNGFPELIIPSFVFSKPLVFTCKGDELVDITETTGLNLNAGPWISVSLLDHDRNTDTPPAILFGNIGLNNVFSTWNPDSDFSLLYYDKSFPHVFEVGTLESDGNLYPVQYFDHLAKMFPFLSRRIPSRQSFGSMNVEEFLPPGWNLKKMETFRSAYYIPDGRGVYINKKLPSEVQNVPIRDAVATDFNQDGKVDLLLASGWNGRKPGDFPLRAESPILLLGDTSSLGYSAIPQGKSGLRIGASTTSVALVENEKTNKTDVIFLTDEGDVLYFSNEFKFN